MQILKEFALGQMTALIVLIEFPDIEVVRRSAARMGARLGTSEELASIHRTVWPSTDDWSWLEYTVALGNTHFSGQYTFVSSGLTERVLTGISADRIRAGHKALLIVE